MTEIGAMGKIPFMESILDIVLVRIKRLMDEQGYKPKRLSLEAGLNATFIRDLFKRKKDPGVTNLGKIAGVLKTTVPILTRKEGDMPAQDRYEKIPLGKRPLALRNLDKMIEPDTE